MKGAAASARLCVETIWLARFTIKFAAAASARLCVETNVASALSNTLREAAASARLCVETADL